MIRQGSILSFAEMDKAGDLRLKVIRFDKDSSLYHLESTRGLTPSTVEYWVLHSWIRAKSIIVGPPET